MKNKELIKEINERIGGLDVRDDIERRAYEIALASLEAEPFVYMNRFTGRAFELEQQPGADKDPAVYLPLYTVSPVPVVSDDKFQRALFVLNETLDDCGDSERGLLLALSEMDIVVSGESCRDTMLQGAEPVSQPYKLPEG
ncbi:TPA: hypothetical protein PL523_004346 [Cronobacter turicensis]|nr:hypothetical protein [Cronobacter turicensis]HDI3035703.1 hypothetical protein [Cronobacter turicensis]